MQMKKNLSRGLAKIVDKPLSKRQLENISVVSKQISDGMNEIRGVMIESHLTEGNQKIGDDLEYGQSITDACINFEDTKQCLSKLSSAVQARRSKI